MEKELHRRLRRRGWVALFVAVTLVILILGYGYYAHETERIRFQKYEDIAGIAKLKVGHIQAWRKGLLSAVSELSNGAAIKNWIREPDNDGPLKDLKDRLIVGQKQGGYADALLVDMDGNIIASASGQPESLNAVEDKAIEHAVASGSPLLTDLYRTPNGAILMDAVAPVLDPNGRSIAVAIYRANPESALFPLIQTWPTPSQTAETLLVRRDGDDVLFLNNLRHRANTALSLREPLTLHDLPAAQAVSAKKGLFQGIDYRGVEVLADLRPIPDSPWFMVAKVDTREILAEAYYRGAVVTVFSGLSILLAAGLTAYGYRSRQARLYKNLYQLDREERKTQELFLDQNVVLYNILESLPYPFYVIDAEDYSLSETNTASRLDNPQGADTCYGLTHHRSEPCSESEHPCPLQEVRKTGKPVIMEHIHFDKDSKPRNVEVHAYPIFDSQGKVIKMIEYSLDITERKLMEDDLRKTRQDWEDIFQSIGHPTIIMDREHRILAANKATIEASGKSLEELLNAKCYEIFHNSGEPPRGCPMEALLKSGSVEPVKMEMEALGRYFVVSCTPVLDKDGTIEKIIHIAIDITERKRAEDETQQNEVRLGKIVNLLHYKADSVQDFLDHALTEALKLTDSKIGYIYHYDEDSKEFVLNTWSTNVMKECSITNPPAVYQLEKTGIWGEAVRQRQPILVNDFQAPHPLKKGYPEGHAPLHRYLTVPDFCGDRIVAVVGVANKESDYNQIDTLQLTLLMNSVWKGVDRLKAEEKIRESEERFSKSFKNNPAFLTITHRGTYKVLEVNDAWTRAFGYTREEAIGRTIVELGIYDEATYRNIIEEAEAKGSVREIEVNIRNRTGEDRVLLISREVVEIQGEPCLLAMGIDITERQKAEKALLESEERYRTVADFTYDWEYWVDANGNFLYVSPSCERITGYSAEEFISDPELMNRIIHQDDRAGMLDHYHKVRQLTPNCVDARDFRVIHRDGETLSISHVCQPVYSPKGQLLGRRGSNRDISVRKQAEEALKISEERYCHVSTLTSDIAYSCLKSGSNAYSIDWLTGATKQILGYSLDDIRALKCWRNLVVDEDLPIFDRHVTGLTPGTSASSELRVRHKDGTIVWVSSFAECVLESESADGLRLYGGLKDITDSKRAEISLKETNAFLDTLVDTIPLPIFYKDTDGRYIGFNKSFEEFYGKARQEFIGKDVFDIYPRDLAETYHAKDLDLLRNPGIQVYEIQVEDSLGVIHDTIIHKSVFSDSQRHVAGLIGVILDVTEPNRVREELRRNEFRFSRAELIARLGNWEIDLSTKRVTASNGARRIYGVGQQELTLEDIQKIPLPEYKSHIAAALYNLINNGAPYDVEFQIKRANDNQVIDIHSIAHYDAEKNTVFGTIHDVTDLRHAEENHKLLFEAMEHSAEAIIITDDKGIIQYVNPAQEIISGYSRNELLGQTPNILKSDLQDDSFYDKLWKTINSGKVWSGRFVNRKKDGTVYHEDATISPVYTKKGKLTNFVAVKHDMTERLKLSEQLFQAQKMEAVGTLAGGIAHDFNNILQAVVGYTELMLLTKKEGEKDYSNLQRIHEAGARGAELVKSLMTFSRKAETKYVPVDLNYEVSSARDLLSRTIPKTINIDLHLKENLESIKADRSQIGQVLMNLGVNARDAMPDGGILTIETTNIQLDEEYSDTHPETKPGSYVLLTVSDTGQGMDKETLSHIFEPFYTTKETGKGTGLGLATVYGVVKQHGGHITCYSEPGLGTTFKILFPTIEKARDSETPMIESPVRGGTETILLVDDEESIKDLGATLLNQVGYKVITANDGKEALEIYQREGDSISLVMLDLIMPEMDGKKCLEEILRVNPNAKVVIASGFSESGTNSGAMAGGAKGFVQKPYNMRELLTKIREVLDKDITGPDNG